MDNHMSALIEDLGVQVYSDTWLNFRPGRDPQTGADIVLCSLARGGFIILWPKEGRSRQVRLPWVGEGWGIAQAPDGAVWQCGYGGSGEKAALCRWAWKGTEAEWQVDLPGDGYFTIDVDAEGRVYAPHYPGNTLYRFTPDQNKLEEVASFHQFGKNVRDVYCALDAWVYVAGPGLLGINPQTGEIAPVPRPEGVPQSWKYEHILRTGDGRVLISLRKWGRACWQELRAGKPVLDSPGEFPLADTEFEQGPHGNNRITCTTPLAFSDGSYLAGIYRKSAIYVTPSGERRSFAIEREESPVRIFSVTSGGERIWGGTFIPLTLFSYHPATGATKFWDNPTEVTGEIYNAVWSRGKLFMASYTGATLTRLTPDRPLCRDRSAAINPAHLGLMKEEGLPLQRPHGKALAPDGTVFFAAHGGYGCVDSGICRINPDTEEVTRWIYANTTFGALVWLPDNRLLVSEQRENEDGIRFTFIDALSGKITGSEIMIRDQGGITSWLPDWDNPSLIYGIHAHRATMFAFDTRQGVITARLVEMRVGDLCYNMLVPGPDGRIWGLSNRCVFAVGRDLHQTEEIAEYADEAGGNFYRFGMAFGPDGCLYFPNGPHLMRLFLVTSGPTAKL